MSCVHMRATLPAGGLFPFLHVRRNFAETLWTRRLSAPEKFSWSFHAVPELCKSICKHCLRSPEVDVEGAYSKWPCCFCLCSFSFLIADKWYSAEIERKKLICMSLMMEKKSFFNQNSRLIVSYYPEGKFLVLFLSYITISQRIRVHENAFFHCWQ